MLVFILGGIVLTLRKDIALPDGRVAQFIVINTFSLPNLMVAFICVPLFLSMCYRYYRVSRRNTDMILALLLLQLLTWSMLNLKVDNIVPEGVASKTIAGAADTTLFTYRLIYTLGLSFLPAMTHCALRYTGNNRFVGWRALQLYAAAIVLSPICWTGSILQVHSGRVSETSNWLHAAPFQLEAGELVILYFAVWFTVNAYVQWLLWPHRRIHEGEDSMRTRVNMVWVGIVFWGLSALVEILIGYIGYEGIGMNIPFQAAAMVAIAVGLARESSHLGRARVEN